MSADAVPHFRSEQRKSAKIRKGCIFSVTLKKELVFCENISGKFSKKTTIPLDFWNCCV
jgi:hypothetical protein